MNIKLNRWHALGMAFLLGAAGPVTAAPVTPFVTTGTRGCVLSAKVGQPVKFSLNLPDKADFSQANVGRFVIRTADRQVSLKPKHPAAGLKEIPFTFTQPGYALVIISAGPGREKGRSDSWQRTKYCTKLVLRIDPTTGPATSGFQMRDPGLMGKVGERIEVVPYIPPPALRVGGDLPVRVYFDGSAQRGATVTAHRPDGSVEAKTSDSVGTVNFRINQPGQWVIRYEKKYEGETYTGELVFEVESPAPQQPPEAGATQQEKGEGVSVTPVQGAEVAGQQKEGGAS